MDRVLKSQILLNGSELQSQDFKAGLLTFILWLICKAIKCRSIPTDLRQHWGNMRSRRSRNSRRNSTSSQEQYTGTEAPKQKQQQLRQWQ